MTGEQEFIVFIGLLGLFQPAVMLVGFLCTAIIKNMRHAPGALLALCLRSASLRQWLAAQQL